MARYSLTRMLEAMDGLSQTHKDRAFQYFVGSKPIQQIAIEAGVSPATVRTSVNNARSRAKRIFEYERLPFRRLKAVEEDIKERVKEEFLKAHPVWRPELRHETEREFILRVADSETYSRYLRMDANERIKFIKSLKAY